MSPRVSAIVCVILSIAVLSSAGSSAASSQWETGEKWVYSLSTNLEVPLLGLLNLTGFLTYEFSEVTTQVVNGSEQEVNIVHVYGDASALQSFYGVSITVSATFSGEQVVLDEGLAILSDELTMRANLTFGEEPFAYTESYGSEVVTSYAPPLLSGFVPGTTVAGSQWEETVVMEIGSAEWANESSPSYANSTMLVNYTCSAQNGVAETDAGTFDTMLITVSSSDMDTRVEYHYSEELANFILVQRFNATDSTQPYMVLSLSEHSTPLDLMLYLIIATLLAVVTVVAVFIFLRSRRPGERR